MGKNLGQITPSKNNFFANVIIAWEEEKEFDSRMHQCFILFFQK